MKAFSTKTYGKWILAGEHAVLRGCPALAFPLTARSLELTYRPGSRPLAVEFSGEHGADFKLLFHGVIDDALARLNVDEPLQGTFLLTSTLPVGAGLGASAALCGAVGRWVEAQGWIATGEVYDFARRLEDLFHGESSGVDLAVSLSGEGLRFVRGGQATPVRPKWLPNLYLSYCGQRGMTAECVGKVKRLFESRPDVAQALDRRMRDAVLAAEDALLVNGPESGLSLLAEAMTAAGSCFSDWGLSQGDLGVHLHNLKEAGAIAVKPTGSGGGGYALSLWSGQPPKSLASVLVPAFVPQDT